MRALRLLVALIAIALLLPGCTLFNGKPVPKSKRDVTICVVRGPMPDVMSAKVKADGRQRVCWKGHGQAYEIYFKAADWPFDEPAPLTPAGEWHGLRAPADSAGDFFTLKRLDPGVTKRFPYEIRTPAGDLEQAPPGGGPEIIGEG